MEKFEKYIKENRLRLDTENLEENTWGNIERSMSNHKKRTMYRKLYVAASILIILGLSSALVFEKNNKENANGQVSIFKGLSPELAEQEEGFIKLVNDKVNEIEKQNIPKENAKLFNEFIKQLEVIDKQYELYKHEIEKTGYNDELIQQIIYNYQLKLSVLQMLQSEIDKINRLTKKDKDEKDKIKLDI